MEAVARVLCIATAFTCAYWMGWQGLAGWTAGMLCAAVLTGAHARAGKKEAGV
jgi:hypothetical protein